jgi:hypothetical protein
MKKVVVFLTLFLVVGVVAMGVTLFTPQKADAFPTYIYCSRDTGAQCTNPLYPYYLYVVDRTGRHFVGCCNGLID